MRSGHWYRAASLRSFAPKVAQAVVTALVTAVLTFLLVRLVPGNPVDAILGTSATPASEAALRHQLHLDQPLPVQFGSFMLDLVHGSFGQSLAEPGHSAWSLIAPALPVTLSVAGAGMVLSVIVGVALGILSAVHRSRVLDVVIRVLAVISIATPPFLVALLLVLVFALRIRAFPAGGWGNGALDDIRFTVIPAITLSFFMIPVITRATRQAAREVVEREFVEAAVARGLSAWRLTSRHILPNSLLPVLSVIGLNVGALLTATVVIEGALGLPGIGAQLVTSVNQRDYPVIQAIALISALFIVTVNLIVDGLYVVLDPRVRRAAL